ncbi:hypothetical protein QYE76_059303 [Lolium multiflorum]|uniref:Uncharacterized protein n=1 Tax=Lolium multiflorum TaxID=4521 RepID=A0AAD8PPS4_LOLMU|nr:hypothetical protein QYE76_059303 [Lolium multiflorum]
MDFLRSGVHFASVDIRNDKIAIKQSWNIEIPSQYHIDLQDLFKLERDRTGMADMAASLIDISYKGMKKEFPSIQHKFWEKNPLDEINLEYAAKDGFVAYELYRIIRNFNYGQRHLLPSLATPTAVQPASTSGINTSSSSSCNGKELVGSKRSIGDEGWTYTRISNGHENWSAAAWGFSSYDGTSTYRFPGAPWDNWPEEKKPKLGWSVAKSVTRCSGGDGGVDGGDDDDDDGDDVQLDDDGDGVDFPHREGISPGIPARRRALSLSCISAPQAAVYSP